MHRLACAAIKLHGTVGSCKKGIIFAATDILTGVEFGAALANDDVSGTNYLAAVFFNSEAFGLGIASVSTRSLTFLMSHN